MFDHHAAAAAIFGAEGRVLLVKENYDRRRYTFPGGRVEPGEAPHEAAIRETFEETGLAVTADHLVGMYRLDSGFVVFLFRCSIRAGTPAPGGDGEIAEVGWFAPDAVPSPASNVLHHALADAVAGRRGVVRDSLPRIN